MTAPLPDDPRQGLSTTSGGITREVVGLLAVLVGLAVVAAVLATVDARWVLGLGGVLLVAGGLWLGRGPDDEGE